MAAIKEWFTVYAFMFDYVREIGGEEGLEEYLTFLGVELGDLAADSEKKEKLEALRDYFEKNIHKDGGACELTLDGGRLDIDIELCPDHLYFASLSDGTPPFKIDYCTCCKSVHRALAASWGLTFAVDGPVVSDDGQFSCSFAFCDIERGGKQP